MPWWGKSKEEKAPETATSSQNASFDHDKLPPREKLPKGLQKIVNEADDSDYFDDLREGYASPSTDSNVRYAAYISRCRTLLLAAHRYVAYTSDIGESFRPIANGDLVRATYGISWIYIGGDVSYEGYKAYWHNQRVRNPHLQLTPEQEKATGLPAQSAPDAKPGVVAPLDDWRTVMVQRGVFQSIASMGLPALTIHSVVRYSGTAMKGFKNARIRTWTPIGLGLAVVPFLPRLFDKPVEQAVEWTFHTAFETLGGKQYVGASPSTGREALLNERPKPKAE
ncbi:Mitochondrial 18kDa protein [Ophiocordyceps camponoti-floridani]|uniref:Mitochondrial fission process protein 1 n=1 Tax=Ophiocordyceps camponoti-floridani TaxID=2030778 RepID=A0A8H4VDW9_9HYPO|nr:Mitochondrial 18kDa protein [Ophiocordyceps camponoti-floridani]